MTKNQIRIAKIKAFFHKNPIKLAKDLQEMSRDLPVGMQEMEVFTDRIISISGPYATRDALQFAMMTAVIHADASKGSLPDSYFVARLRKAAANQVASQVFQDIKTKQQEAQKVAQQTAADTATTEPVSNGEKGSQS